MRSRVSRVPVVALAGAVLIAVAVSLLLIQIGPSAWALELGDSDNFMRLAEVRDWLGGQSWWDIRQHRVDPPHGLYTHWSRLADLPLAAAIVALRPFVPEIAERLALVVVPLLLLVPALLLQSAIATGLGGRLAGLAALGLGALATPMLVQFVPGRIDHHGLQIVLVLAAVAVLVRWPGARGGAWAAVASAVSLTVGLETAPYLAVIAGYVALDWAWHGDDQNAASTARGYGIALAVAVPALFAATVPIADWSLAKGDAIGRGHVAIAVVGGVALAVLPQLWLGRDARLVAVAALGVILAGLVLKLFPELILAPYAMVGPLLARLWMGHIVEMRSVFADAATSPMAALGRVWFVAVAAVAAVILARRGGRKLLVALLAVTALGLGCWEMRALGLATAVAVPQAGAALAALWHRRAAGGSLMPFIVGLLIIGHLPSIVLSARASAPAVDRGLPCNTPSALAPLAVLPRGVVLAPIDMGGSLLALTPHSVVATPIHRDVHGNMLAYTILRAPPSAEPPPGIDYIGYCPADGETRILAADAPRGLLAALIAGRVPPWLTSVGSGPFRTWRVTASR
ncbi:hypothetical protein [Polymorphobacter megasporae]|uniref:hypothetical protein n=1 Tax=Glacieibacterium megasporae TaxID=2835787 RepID=UPI001C1E6038|nr:hypothetical protein [Polymorphobacter megasporae]UAJ09161.1 hypothetical protein KTC28_12495 [Polymorphobacter megasporae]